MPKTAKKTQETPSAEAGKGVEISSLNTLQLFTYHGHIYTKRRAHPGGVKALSQKGDELITLPPDTLVTPV